ncbi:MAG: HEPN domain-containing protein [Acidobacteria bacterium]|nr:HEPN domain-containing protein [Acidobacteriota bacterium]
MNKDHALAEWGRATEALGAASALAALGFNADCVSRAYYAMNHAAKAALAVDEVVADTHDGLKRMFGLHLVRTGVIEKQWAGDLHAGVDQRLGADYDVYAAYTKDHAAVECERAGRFVERMRVYLLNRGVSEPELVEVERVALGKSALGVGDQSENPARALGSGVGATEARASQSQSQESAPSWKDKVQSELGIDDQPVDPPNPPSSAAGAAEAAQRRGQQRNGPER